MTKKDVVPVWLRATRCDGEAECVVRSHRASKLNPGDRKMTDFIPRIDESVVTDMAILLRWEEFLIRRRIPYVVTRHHAEGTTTYLKLWKIVDFEEWPDTTDD
jgi:hypothetical protein